ncbi:hypothetical protein [Okeania sp. SIO1I7]|uniref:WD40 domain-containing protein n=1 Tax=Okeania sp. SIO1I7 TaxID=2607772 RepID=UPI0013FB7FA3|nr:hypothetical protein [Okeania sp. SIO1I7]NET25385.1 hypothetical protein [Okeania sp. SIO1I7]
MSTHLEINNQKLLQKLIRGMKMSQGQFRLFLAQCNNLSQRDRLIPQLRESFSGDLAELQLDESVDELYATIRKRLRDQQPDALMIWGLEFVRDIDKLLVAMSLVREEFRKNCPFPIVLWVDAEIYRKFIRLIPDFESWASLTVFETATQELIDFIQQTSESIYQKVLESGAGIFLDDTALGLGEFAYQELVGARQELLNREVTLELELEANLEFVLGRATDNSTETALEHYQHSLELWQQINNSVRVAHTYYYLGLWWRSYAVRHRVEKNMACEKACSYFQQSVKTFEAVNRPDLAAKFINAWGEVLQTLGRWDELETVANRAIELHQTYSQPFCEARAYAFLAEFELAKNNYRQAKKLAQNAIEIFNKTLDVVSPPSSEKDKINLDLERYSHLGKYLFALAKSEKYLGKFEESIANFEQAKKTTKPEYRTEFYICLLTESRKIYYQQKAYLAAFKLKQERQKIEQQFGFVAFVGANRLGYRKPNTNPALPQVNRRKVTQEISASGRQLNVEELLERISRPDYKLIVIHGQSGVGKSSILQAGLIPALNKKSIDTHHVVVVLQQVYIHWISELGESLAKKLKTIPQLAVNSQMLNSTEAIFSQLRNNAELNLLTVIIFDQFEEFFFVNSEPGQKREFAQFLEECLEIPFVKIVLSLRSDYIHYLLEFNDLANLETINNDILSKNILYELRNFSQNKAKSVIKELTENSQFKIDSKLTEKLVEDLAQETKDIRPIELQIVGAQLQTENITTVEKYQELGDYPKAELVNRYLASVVKDCGEENEKLAWLVLMLLTDENNTRPLKTQAELAKERKLNVDSLELVLDIFVKSGLVFLLPEKPAKRYQLVHDYLVAFIRQRKEDELFQELKQERKQRKLSEARLNVVLKQQLRQSRIAITVLTMLSAFVVVLWLNSESQKRRAELAKVQVLNSNFQLQLSLNHQLDALVAITQAGKRIKHTSSPPKLQNQIKKNLQQAVRDVEEYNRLEYDHPLWSVSYSPDGQKFASAGQDNNAILWQSDGKVEKVLKGHTDNIWSVNFSPDGKIIASVSKDRTIILWSQDGTFIRQLKGHRESVTDVSFSPDSQIIASSSFDDTIKLWNQNGELLQTLKEHKDDVLTVNFSPDGKTLASAGADNKIRLWDRNGKLLKVLEGHQDWVWSITFSRDSQMLASGSFDKTIKLWDRNGTLLRTLEGHTNRVLSVDFSFDDRTLASASLDKTIRLWHRDGTLLRTLKGHTDGVRDISFSPDNQTIVSAGLDKTIRLWKYENPLLKTIGRENKDIGHRKQVTTAIFDPTGQIIASASYDGTVKLWSTDGSLLETFSDHEEKVNEISFSPDGQTIASASDDGTVKLWSKDGSLLETFSDHEKKVNGISFSPDGKTIASASEDKTIKLWNINEGLISELKGHQRAVNDVIFSPDGKTLISASEDGVIKIWKLNGQLLKTIPAHLGNITSLSFSPDAPIFASASDDNTIKIWSKDGTPIRTLKGHNSRVWSVDFSPDGKILASASADRTIKIWSLDGTELQSIQDNGFLYWGNVSFSPNDQMIASASKNTIKLWKLNRENLEKLAHTMSNLDALLVTSCSWLNDYLGSLEANNTEATTLEKTHQLCD